MSNNFPRYQKGDEVKIHMKGDAYDGATGRVVHVNGSMVSVEFPSGSRDEGGTYSDRCLRLAPQWPRQHLDGIKLVPRGNFTP